MIVKCSLNGIDCIYTNNHIQGKFRGRKRWMNATFQECTQTDIDVTLRLSVSVQFSGFCKHSQSINHALSIYHHSNKLNALQIALQAIEEEKQKKQKRTLWLMRTKKKLFAKDSIKIWVPEIVKGTSKKDNTSNKNKTLKYCT